MHCFCLFTVFHLELLNCLALKIEVAAKIDLHHVSLNGINSRFIHTCQGKNE